MSEVTKLYENAGIEPEYKDCCIITDKYLNYETELSYEDLMDKECPHNQECTDECEYAYNKIIYPPFTAEKLINLVMFLINKGDFDIKKGSVDITFESFTSCIAGLINNLWQDLTEEECKQIKEILK